MMTLSFRLLRFCKGCLTVVQTLALTKDLIGRFAWPFGFCDTVI